MTADMLIAGGISCAVTAVLGIILIPFLRRVKFGQPVYDGAPVSHAKKQGTPTMGGFMFMIGITAAVVASGFFSQQVGKAGFFILAFGWLFGIIGFIDDFFKVVKKQNHGGLSEIQKLSLQAAVSLAFMSLLRFFGILHSDFVIPFTGVTVEINWVLYLIAGAILVCGMVNAVNLTDGLDGLCSGIMLPIAVALAILAAYGERYSEGIVAAALAGGMLGFLFYNRHPASVFMGDTGALFLGGMLCGLCFALDKPLIMIIIGALYIVDMFSVIIQRLWFKYTKRKYGAGRRVFKKAPLHHHFELSGQSEVRIVVTSVLITAALCAAVILGRSLF